MLRSVREEAVVCLVLLVAASGCLAGSPAGEDQENGHVPSGTETAAGGPSQEPGNGNVVTAEPNFRATGCEYVYLETRTTADKLEPYLPPGFSFAQPSPATPLVVVDHHACEKVVVGNLTEVAGFAQGRLTMRVIPPDEIAPPDDYSTSLVLQQWVNSEDVLASLASHRVPSALGTTSWETTADNPLIFLASGSVESGEGGEGWTFEILADSETLQETQLRRVYFVDEEAGNVTWYDESRQGYGNWRDYGGVLMPAPGSLLSELTVNPNLVAATNDIGTSMEYHVELGKA